MANLLEETIEALEENGKSFDDVIGVCGDKFQIPIEQFKELANREYNDGFGAQKVASDLKIIGKNFWLERHEYDGSEWWEYKTFPNLNNLPMKSVKRVIGGMWDSLSKIQNDKYSSDY